LLSLFVFYFVYFKFLVVSSEKYIFDLDERKKFAISNQLLRSATSIGANVREAQNAESQPDFIHKLKIAAKEAEETMYWLDLCLYSPSYPNTEKEKEELNSIIKIINKIIGTLKSRMKQRQ